MLHATMPPTADCYCQAYDRLMELDRDGERDVALAHGWIMNPNGRFAHAWVETQAGKFVLETTAPDGDGVYEAATYYRALAVVGVVRYAPTEASAAMMCSGHYGPWDPAFGE